MPEAMGEKTRAMVQEALAATEPLQVSEEMLKSEALKPLRTALRICKETLPELVTVMLCGLVKVPCVGVPGNVRVEAGFRETEGAPGAGVMDVPVRAMDWGLPAALSAMKRMA